MRAVDAIILARRALWSSWRFRIWLGAAVVLGGVLCTLPLFGVLGYELALVAAIFGSLAGLDLGAAMARRGAAAARQAPAARATRRVTAAALLTSLAVIAAPALLAAMNGARVPTCDWWFGVTAYFLLAVLSTLWSTTVGVAIGLLVRHRVIGNLLPPLFWLGIAALGLWRFYAAPPVFSYNPLLGYFPGNLYDENVALDARLYWSRLEDLLTAGAVLFGAAAFAAPTTLARAWPAARRGAGQLLTGAAFAGATLALHLQGGQLGYAVDAATLDQVLPGRKETAHFVIHYPRTKEIEADIDLIAADHEFRYAQVVALLGDEPASAPKIHSYYFPDRSSKARWIGARDVEMAKPWRREIYLTAGPFPIRALRHEIAHAVAGSFGDPWFHVASRRVLGLPVLANPGLIEGVAVAVDWPGGYERSMTPHQAVNAMLALGVAPGIEQVFSLRFLSVSSTRSYTAAGSFIRFLLERYGATALRAVYHNGGDFPAAYQKSLGELAAEWRAFLATLPPPGKAAESVRERFARGSVFARPCPHAVAKRLDRAMELASADQIEAAIAVLRRICDDSPGETRYRLELADQLAKSSTAHVAEAQAIYEELAGEGHPSSLRADALRRLAKAAARRGEWSQAAARLATALALPIDDDARRNLEGAAFAIAHDGPAAPHLRDYFFGKDNGLPAAAAAATEAEPSLGLAVYLRGLRRLDKPDHAGAAADFAAALRLGLPTPRFTSTCARHLAATGFRVGDLDAVQRAATELDRAQSEVDRLVGEDWRARLAFTRR